MMPVTWTADQLMAGEYIDLYDTVRTPNGDERIVKAVYQHDSFDTGTKVELFGEEGVYYDHTDLTIVRRRFGSAR